MKNLTILTINNVIHEVLFENEISDFIEKTPEWDLNVFRWHDVESESELSDFTFYNSNLCSKVKTVYPKFSTNITVEKYWEYILKLEINIKRNKLKKKTQQIIKKCGENIHLFYNDVQKIQEYAHQINTCKVFDFDTDINDITVKLILLPLIEQGLKC